MRLHMHWFAIVFELVWFGTLLLFFCLLMWAWFSTPESFEVHPVIVALIFPGSLVFGIGLHTFGRWLARGEGDSLLLLLKETLEAEEVPM